MQGTPLKCKCDHVFFKWFTRGKAGFEFQCAGCGQVYIVRVKNMEEVEVYEQTKPN